MELGRFWCNVSGIDMCIPRDAICDGIPQCEEEDDEVMCSVNGLSWCVLPGKECGKSIVLL